MPLWTNEPPLPEKFYPEEDNVGKSPHSDRGLGLYRHVVKSPPTYPVSRLQPIIS